MLLPVFGNGSTIFGLAPNVFCLSMKPLLYCSAAGWMSVGRKGGHVMMPVAPESCLDASWTRQGSQAAYRDRPVWLRRVKIINAAGSSGRDLRVVAVSIAGAGPRASWEDADHFGPAHSSA
ncbi:hypothetical protein SEVIR_9G336850v4 [Setaria viridis]